MDYFYFKQQGKIFQNAEKNFSKLNINLFAYQSTNFEIKLKDIQRDDRLYTYWIITIPVFSIFIRCLYNDIIEGSFGLYIFFIMSLLVLGLWGWVKFDLENKRKKIVAAFGAELFQTELNEKELSTLSERLGPYRQGKAQDTSVIELLSNS
jgi:hypothetical protein